MREHTPPAGRDDMMQVLEVSWLDGEAAHAELDAGRATNGKKAMQ